MPTFFDWFLFAVPFWSSILLAYIFYKKAKM